MLTQNSPSHSLEEISETFPQPSNHLIACQVQTLLEEINSKQLSSNTIKTRYILNQPESVKFALSIIEYLFEKKMILNEELEAEAISFFKVFLFKSNFNAIGKILKQIFKSISGNLDKSLDTETFISKIFSFLSVLSNWNSGKTSETSLIFNGVSNRFTIHSDKDKNPLRMFLNLDFTFLMSFKIDFKEFSFGHKQLVLMAFHNEFTEQGYSIFLLDDVLWFRMMLPIKGPEMLTEFPLFEKVSEFCNNNWNSFIFESQYNPSSKSTNLKFQLNNKVFLTNKAFEDPFFRSQKQSLTILDGAFFELSALCVVNSALNAEKIRSIQAIFGQNGLTTVELVDIFMRCLDQTFESEGIWLFYHPFCEMANTEEGLSIIDWCKQKLVIIPEQEIILKNTSFDFLHELIASQFFEVVLSLLNFVSSESDLKDFFKIIRSLFSHQAFLKEMNLEKQNTSCKMLLSSLISTKKHSFFDKKAIEALIYILKSQNDKNQLVFLNYVLFDFNFIDRMLTTEAQISVYFDEITRFLSLNTILFVGMNLNRLSESTILFLDNNSPLTIMKALFLLKILLIAVKIRECVEKLQIDIILKYLFSPINNQSIINLTVLNIIKSFIKLKGVEKKHQHLYLNSLTSLFFFTDEPILIKKIISLMTKSKNFSVKFLTFLWRKKFLKAKSIDRTKKVFWSYLQIDQKMKNSEIFIKFACQKSFLNLKKNNVFGDEEMLIDKDGLFDFLLESSLIAEPFVLQHVVQCLIVSISNKDSNFIEFSVHSNFLIWVVSLIFTFFESPVDSMVCELCMKLFITFSVNCYKLTGTLDHINTISECVNMYSFESGKEKIKFVIFKNLIEEFNRQEIIFDNQYNLNCFVIFFYKYYQSNLASGPFDDFYINSMNSFLSMAHRTINLNPLPSLPIFLTEEIGSLFSERRRLIASLITSTSFTSKNLAEVKSGFCCSIKFLTLITLDILEAFSQKVKKQDVSFDTIFEFINAFFYRLNYFLENNKKKLRVEKIYIFESSIYYIVKQLFAQPMFYPFLKEIVETVMFFVPKIKGEEEVHKKVLKELGVPINAKPIDYFYTLKNDTPPKIINIQDFLNVDFENGKTDFLLLSIGKINDSIENTDFSGQEVVLSNSELESFVALSEFEHGRTKYIQLLSFRSFNEYSCLSKMYNFYYNMYSKQFELNGLLCDPAMKLLCKLKIDFDSNHHNFSASRNKLIKYKHHDFVTNGHQTPFIQPVLKKKLTKLKLIDDFKLTKHFSFQNYFEYCNNTYYSVQIIDRLYFIPSFLSIDTEKKQLQIFTDVTLDSQILNKFTGIEIKKFKRKTNTKLTHKINFSDLLEVLPFKFFQQKIAALVLLKNKKQIVINFFEENLANNFISILKNVIAKSEGFNTFATKFCKTPQELTDKWLSHKISNFEFLMEVNLFSSRSTNDFSQYPIFPLLFKKFDNVIILRDLEKPIGMNGDEKAIENYQQIYESARSPDDEPFFYGSHYSNPAHVFNFLVRKIPETIGSKAIHNNDYDFPDRIFCSFPVMVKNIIEDAADVRELIPEFFYLPEVLININNIDFKNNQNGDRVHNVILPEACKNNPYRFIMIMRQLLESPVVSLKLGSWIDLIFGFKQFGVKAIEAKNVFYPLTYEQNFKNIKFIDDETQKAVFNQIYNFGQTPLQIYSKLHQNKKITGDQQTIASTDSKTKYFLRYRDLDHGFVNDVLFVKKIKEKGLLESKATKRLVIVKTRFVEIWKFKISKNIKNASNPYQMVLEHNMSYEKCRKTLLGFGLCFSKINVIEVFSENRIVFGGILNGSIVICNYKLDKILSKQVLHEKMLVKIHFTNDEKLITIDTSDIICIWNFDSKTNNFSIYRSLLSLYKTGIVEMNFCLEDQKLVCLNTKESIEVRPIDNFSNILLRIEKADFKNLKMLEVIDECLTSQAFLSLGYVNCIVFFAHFGGKNHLFSISLLGQIIGYYILEDVNEPVFTCFEFVADECFRKHLIVINQRGDVFLFDLPFFECGRKINSNQNNVIKHLSMFLKKKLAMIIDHRGYIDILSSGSSLPENIA